MSQFITNPIDQIVDLLVSQEEWDAGTIDEVGLILMRSGDLTRCGCGHAKRPDDDLCPHHNVYPRDDDA